MREANKFYWLCQICGWGAYSAVGLWSAGLDHGWRPSAVIGYILFFLYDIALTHLLRIVIRGRNWTSLPLPRILVRLALASILIGAVQTTLVVGVYTAIEGSLGPPQRWLAS
jgi:two-component system, LytTR family, sensor kinase